MLATEMRKITDDVDDGFLYELLERCRDVCADCTLEEIGHFAQIKARYRGINKSFTGFLLKAIPQCLAGEAFRQYRNAVQAQKESERKELRRMKKESDEILMDHDKRELWEIENAQDTQNYVNHAWVFESDIVGEHPRPERVIRRSRAGKYPKRAVHLTGSTFLKSPRLRSRVLSRGGHRPSASNVNSRLSQRYPPLTRLQQNTWILFICSGYGTVTKKKHSQHGVAWESVLARQELYERKGTSPKYLSILLGTADLDLVPLTLRRLGCIV